MLDVYWQNKIRVLENRLDKQEKINDHLEETILTLASWLVDTLGQTSVLRLIELAKSREFLKEADQ